MELRVAAHLEKARSAITDGEVLSAGGSASGIVERAFLSMLHAAWAMLLAAGETVSDHEAVIPALEKHFGNNSKFYGLVTGARDVLEKCDFELAEVSATNAQNALENAKEFLSMADYFLATGDKRSYEVST